MKDGFEHEYFDGEIDPDSLVERVNSLTPRPSLSLVGGVALGEDEEVWLECFVSDQISLYLEADKTHLLALPVTNLRY